MVRSTLTLLALFNVAILFPGKAMSQNSEGREFNGKYQKEYLDKIAFPIGGIGKLEVGVKEMQKKLEFTRQADKIIMCAL